MLSARIDKAGWSWGCVSAIDSNGRTIWIADAHRGDGKRFVVHADEKLTALLELESATPESSRFTHQCTRQATHRRRRDVRLKSHRPITRTPTIIKTDSNQADD